MSKGFTLLELLLVLILIGICSSLVFVSVTGGLLRSEKSKFFHSFTQGLLQARTASLGRGEPVKFIIDAGERTYSVGQKQKGTIPEVIQIEGNGILELGDGIYCVYFFPDGSSSGGEIDLKVNGKAIKRISIDKILGIIHTEDPQT